MSNWYDIGNVNTIDSPQVVIYADRVQHNIDAAVKMVGDVNRLRPHIKTNKTPQVVQMMLAAGITRFKCATIEEAALLASLKAPDVLLAYQPVGPKVERLYLLTREYPATRFSCLTDHVAPARALHEYFSAHDARIEVFMDLNVGMNRTGISLSEAPLLAEAIQQMKGLRWRGIHAYDGHFRDPDISIRKAACDAQFEQVKAFHQNMQENFGIPLSIIAGGSPTFPIHALREDVECSPGTFVFWDKGYGDICAEQPFLPAALVLSRVISLPSPGKICIDMGHKSIAAENDISRRAWFVNEPEALLLSQSEEHGLVQPVKEHQPGDLMYVMPYHVCPTINLYSSLVVVKNGRAEDSWKVAAKH
ncbi:MAG: D-TA family PLP-dependent enzyme [Chitinophagaceae bacterium]